MIGHSLTPEGRTIPGYKTWTRRQLEAQCDELASDLEEVLALLTVSPRQALRPSAIQWLADQFDRGMRLDLDSSRSQLSSNLRSASDYSRRTHNSNFRPIPSFFFSRVSASPFVTPNICWCVISVCCTTSIETLNQCAPRLTGAILRMGGYDWREHAGIGANRSALEFCAHGDLARHPRAL